SLFYCCFFFFFFQAEDGIRDGHVTGVQTCALPIWPVPLVDVGRDELRAVGVGPRDDERRDAADVGREAGGGERAQERGGRDEDRSEERRVGKECRSRWWPSH